MDKEKVTSEISRLINLSSRKLREGDKAPSASDLAALSKLVTAYTGLLEIEGDEGSDVMTQEKLLKIGAGYECAQGLKPMPKIQRTPKGMRKRDGSHA
ncbi:MAG: hypothetical protein GX654_14200 [Desulfatiglans sp.]|nr:hypothetical protein [Desulfatiglans sp.]